MMCCGHRDGIVEERAPYLCSMGLLLLNEYNHPDYFNFAGAVCIILSSTCLSIGTRTTTTKYLGIHLYHCVKW
jgi:hypothetical protein